MGRTRKKRDDRAVVLVEGLDCAIVEYAASRLKNYAVKRSLRCLGPTAFKRVGDFVLGLDHFQRVSIHARRLILFGLDEDEVEALQQVQLPGSVNVLVERNQRESLSRPWND